MSTDCDDPVVNDMVLTVVNDGNGDQCGYSYPERLRVARMPNVLARDYLFRCMCEHYDRHCRVRDGTTERPTTFQLRAAARELRDYYDRHIAEVDA